MDAARPSVHDLRAEIRSIKAEKKEIEEYHAGKKKPRWRFVLPNGFEETQTTASGENFTKNPASAAGSCAASCYGPGLSLTHEILW